MLYGAHEAGLALNASVVVGHSLAYAVAARTGLSHGVTCAMALPYCLAYSRPAAEQRIAELARQAEVGDDATALFDWFLDLAGSLGVESSLEAVGIDAGDLHMLAAEVIERYARPNSPVPLALEPLEALLHHFHAGDARGAWDEASPYIRA
jgi:alcohol dehydrogenase class IV